MDSLGRVLGEVRDAVYLLDGGGRVTFHNGRLPPGLEASDEPRFNDRVPAELRIAWPPEPEHATIERVTYRDALHHRHRVRRRVVPLDEGWVCLVASEEHPDDATRLELLGRLVLHVAHDLNNMLTAVVGFADLLSQSVGEEGVEREWCRDLRRAARQAAGFAHRLMVFGDAGAAHPQVIELNDHLAGLVRTIHRVLPEPTRVEFRPSKGEVAVSADPHHLDQAVLALALGLQDILVPGGRLRFTVDPAPAVVIDASALRADDLEPSFDGLAFARNRFPVRRPEPTRFAIDLEA